MIYVMVADKRDVTPFSTRDQVAMADMACRWAPCRVAIVDDENDAKAVGCISVPHDATIETVMRGCDTMLRAAAQAEPVITDP